MKIGIIADTHLSSDPGVLRTVTESLRNTRRLEDIATLAHTYFYDADLILHAGDLVDLGVLDVLRPHAPVEAVYGNMDSAEARRSLSEQRTIPAERFSIGLRHGDGGPHGIVERVGRHFSGVDAIVFGHTHHPLNEWHEGVLYFNPGSPTDRIFAPYNSIGILEIGQHIEGRIIRV